MSVFFSRFMGYESQCGTNKSHENRFAVHAICLFRTAIHIPWTEKKRHSFLNCVIITNCNVTTPLLMSYGDLFTRLYVYIVLIEYVTECCGIVFYRVHYYFTLTLMDKEKKWIYESESGRYTCKACSFTRLTKVVLFMLYSSRSAIWRPVVAFAFTVLEICWY